MAKLKTFTDKQKLMEYITSGITLEKKCWSSSGKEGIEIGTGNLDLHKRMENVGNKYMGKNKKMFKNLKRQLIV